MTRLTRTLNFATPFGGLVAAVIFIAFAALMIMAAGGLGFRFDPFDSASRRADLAEATADAATSEASASRAIRFLYRKGGGEERLVDMRSWTRRGGQLIGFDREADGIRTFRADRITRHLPAEGGADPGALAGSIRGGRGGVKRKAAAMFSKLRTASHLKAGATPDEAYVEFTARASRLARIHHFGLKDRVVPDGPETQYPQRELLGFSQADDEAILALIAEDMGLA